MIVVPLPASARHMQGCLLAVACPERACSIQKLDQIGKAALTVQQSSLAMAAFSVAC